MTRQLLALLMIGWAATGAPLQHAPATAQGAPYYAGWAMSAYPEMSQDALGAAVARQKAAGANLVWIGHNNPGEVGARKREPALSYAVYAAYRDPRDPLHADAVAITRAQFRMLAACRKAGMAAVFPIGYQIQMGKAWNAAHPGDVRRRRQRLILCASLPPRHHSLLPVGADRFCAALLGHDHHAQPGRRAVRR